MELRVRNVLCEYSMGIPDQVNKKYFEGPGRIPTFHVFGMTEQGQKACVHIHGVFPYIVLKVGSPLTPNVERMMTLKLNRLLTRELTEARRGQPMQLRNHIYKIEPINMKSMYGYQSEPETFAKVYLLNPPYVTKLAQALSKELHVNPGFQPFESHVPFTLQFFTDYSLFGMDLLYCKDALFRIADTRSGDDILYDNKTVSELRRNKKSPLAPMTSCWIECDVMESDIDNGRIYSHNEHSTNPGLDYIWREEAARCLLQNRELVDTFNNYAPRPSTMMPAEKEQLKRLKEAAKQFKETEKMDNMGLTQALNETITPEAFDESDIVWSQQEFSDDEDVFLPEVPQEDPPVADDKYLKRRQQSDDEDDDRDYDECHLRSKLKEGTSGTLKKVVKKKKKKRKVSKKRGKQPVSEESNGTWKTLARQLPFRCRTDPDDMVYSQRSTCSEPCIQISQGANIGFHDSVLDQTSVYSSLSQDIMDPEDGEVSEVSHFCVVSVEVFAYTARCMPDATEDAVMGVSICVMPDVCRSLNMSENVFVTTIADQFESDNIIVVPDELAIFQYVINCVKKWDPELLVGYDIDRLSWGYLFRRSQVIGLPDFHVKLGRYDKPSDVGYQAKPILHAWAITDSIPAPTGRLLVAVWKSVRADAGLRNYDRATACTEILKKKIPVLTDAHLSKMVERFNRSQNRTVAQYMQKLSYSNIAILSEMDWFLKNAEMARVYGIQFHEVWTRGSQFRVESMLLRLAHKLNYVAPSITPHQRNRMAAPEQLQLILEPASKVYHDPVIVLDFQSLYPSMVIAYNYCYSTFIGKVAHVAQAAEKKEKQIRLGAIQHEIDVKPVTKHIAERQVHCSPLHGAFVKKDVQDGLLPLMLREILGARIMVKNAMKRMKSKRLKRIMNARQLALKLVANVTYGYTAANWSGRMPCAELADAILGKGRETLERAIEMVNSGKYGPCRVIYGDTDSMFVLVPKGTRSSAFEIGRRIADDVTADNPAPVVLKLEKVYMGCALETKKRYAGWMFEHEDDEGKLESKGIETIRRDTCPIVAKMLARCLELIFKRKWASLNVYLMHKLSNLHNISYTDFVFSKEYRGMYSKNSMVPQKMIAEVRVQRNPAHITLPGERIQYVVVEGHPEATVISCVKSINHFVEHPNLKINVAYYANSHILAAIRRVTNLIPIEIEYQPIPAIPCYSFGCNFLGHTESCKIQSKSKKAVLGKLMERVTMEMKMKICMAACKQCQHNVHLDIYACRNWLCPVKKRITEVIRYETAAKRRQP